MSDCGTCALVARRDAGAAPAWDCILSTPSSDVVHAFGTAVEGWTVLALRHHVTTVSSGGLAGHPPVTIGERRWTPAKLPPQLVWRWWRMSAPIETVQEFMAAFVAAWPNQDAAKVASFVSPDGVYHNIPMDPVKGRQAIETTLGGLMALGGKVTVDVAHILADGPIVMVERVDCFARDGHTFPCRW